MVMDGSNKGLDVLSVASDEAGMNHPSGAAEHDAAQSPRPPPCHPSRLCPSIPLSFCFVPLPSLHGEYALCTSSSKHSTSCHYSINRYWCILCKILWGLFIHLETQHAHSSKHCTLFINFVSKHHLLTDCDACKKKIQSTQSATPHE